MMIRINNTLKMSLYSSISILTIYPATLNADESLDESLFKSAVFVDSKNLLEDAHANPKSPLENVYDMAIEASSTAKKFVDRKVQTAVEDQIHSTAVKAGELAKKKIFDFFFQDKERYGTVTRTGDDVTIYTHRSQVLNNVFKFATGQTIDENIAQLPFGMSHLANLFKVQLEKLVVKQVISKLGSLGVEAAVENALLAGYGYTKNKIFDSINTPKPVIKTQQDLNIEKNIEEFLADFEKEAQRVTVSDSFFEEKLNDEFATKSGTTITLKDVFNDYAISLTEKLNDYFKTVLIDVVSAAADEVAQQSVQYAAGNARAAMFAAGTVSAPFNLATAVAMVGGGALLGEFTGTLAQHAGNYASDKAEKIARHNLGDLVTPDYAAQESRTTHERVVDDLNMSFIGINFNPATLSTWADAQLKAVEEVAVDTVDVVADKIINVKNGAAEFLDNVGDALDALHGFDPAPREEREEFTTGGIGQLFVTGVKRFFSDAAADAADHGDYLYGEGSLEDYDARQAERDLEREKLAEVRKVEDAKQAQALKAKQEAIKLERQALKTENKQPKAKGWFSWW